MTKAEKAAIAYQLATKGPNVMGGDSILSEEEYKFWNINYDFKAGYEQAEKDLVLTWEDAQLLHIITEKYMRELDNRIEAFPSSSQELYEEVLRRFNEHKK